MPKAREDRLALNEASFRALNEQLRTTVHASLQGPQSNLAGFVCECGDIDCAEVVQMPLSRYEEIRQDSRLFLIAVGHEFLEVEDVVQIEDTFAVVRKHDSVAEIVEATDPRT